MKHALFLLRVAVTALFLLSLLVVDFNHPQDIFSVATLQKLTHPQLLSQALQGNLRQIGGILREVNATYVFLALAAHLACVALLTWRWQLLLTAQGIRIGFARLFAYYLMGFFFNNFLPTNIGGDVSRVYNVAKHAESTTTSFAVVFMERFVGFVAVFGLALLAVFFHSEWFTQGKIQLLFVLFGVAIVLACWVLWDPRLRQALKRLIQGVRLQKMQDMLSQFHESILQFKGSYRVLWGVFGISLVYQIALVAVNLFAAHSVGATPSFLPVFFTIQITTLICLIPISVNGLGIRESFYMKYIHSTVPDGNRIRAFLAVLLLVNYGLSLLGGLCFALQKGKSEWLRKKSGTKDGKSAQTVLPE